MGHQVHLAVLDQLGSREIRVTLVLRVPEVNQVLTVPQAQADLEEILDLVATKDLSDNQDCKDLQDSLV